MYRTTAIGGREGSDLSSPHLPPQLLEGDDTVLKQPAAILQLLQKIYSPLVALQNQVIGVWETTYLRNFYQYKHPVYHKAIRLGARNPAPQPKGFFDDGPTDHPIVFDEFLEAEDDANDQEADGSWNDEASSSEGEDVAKTDVAENGEDGSDDPSSETASSDDEPDTASARMKRAVATFKKIYVRADENYNEGSEEERESYLSISDEDTTSSTVKPLSALNLFELTTIIGKSVGVTKDDFALTEPNPYAAQSTKGLKRPPRKNFRFNNHLIDFWLHYMMREAGLSANFFCLTTLDTHVKSPERIMNLPSSLFLLDVIFLPQHVDGDHWILWVIRPKKRQFLYLDSLNPKNTQKFKAPPLMYPMLNRAAKEFGYVEPDFCGEDVFKQFSAQNDPVTVLKVGNLQEGDIECGVFCLAFIEILLRLFTIHPDADIATIEKSLQAEFKTPQDRLMLIADVRSRIRLCIAYLAPQGTLLPEHPSRSPVILPTRWEYLLGPHKLFFPDTLFRYLECGGRGDCQYLSILVALIYDSRGKSGIELINQDNISRLKALDPQYFNTHTLAQLVVDLRKLVGDNCESHLKTHTTDPRARAAILESVEIDHAAGSSLPAASSYEKLAELIRKTPRHGDDFTLSIISQQLGINFWVYREQNGFDEAALKQVNTPSNGSTKWIILKYRGDHYQLIGHQNGQVYYTVLDSKNDNERAVLQKLENVQRSWKAQGGIKNLEMADHLAEDMKALNLTVAEAQVILQSTSHNYEKAKAEVNFIYLFQKEIAKNNEDSIVDPFNLKKMFCISINWNREDLWLARERRLLYHRIVKEYGQHLHIAQIEGAIKSNHWKEADLREELDTLKLSLQDGEAEIDPLPEIELGDSFRQLTPREQRHAKRRANTDGADGPKSKKPRKDKAGTQKEPINLDDVNMPDPQQPSNIEEDVHMSDNQCANPRKTRRPSNGQTLQPPAKKTRGRGSNRGRGRGANGRGAIRGRVVSKDQDTDGDYEPTNMGDRSTDD